MAKRLKDWFHLKDDFTSFRIIPQKHAQYFFGQEDCRLRDSLLQSLEESTYSQRGHHAVIFGQAGRGKTQLANNLLHEAGKNDLPLQLVYVDCPTIPSAKAPIKTFFAQLFRSIPLPVIERLGRAYLEKCKVDPEIEVQIKREVQDDHVYKALKNILTTANDDFMRHGLQWLGGENWEQVRNMSPEAPFQIANDSQIVRNVGAIGQVFLKAEDKNLIFMIDEAERFQAILQGEQYWKWLAALREVFRREAVGLMLFIIARNRDDIPAILVQEEEILTVIGTNNIHDCRPYSEPEAKSFLEQLLAHLVKRDPCPPALQAILDNAGEKVDTYPFTADAFERFIDYHSGGENVNIPREIINDLEKSAQRAMNRDKKLIDLPVLQEVIQGNV